MGTIEQKLNDFIQLYRLCERPTICDESFSYNVETASEEVVKAIQEFLKHSETDITGLTPDKDSIKSGKSLSFDCQIPPQGFHKTIELFVKKTPSLHKGNMSSEFYICEGDYLHGSNEITDKVSEIQKTCRFITFLKEIITHTEEKTNYIRFILLTHDKDSHSARKQIFESRYQLSDITDLSGLQQLEQIIDEQDLHRGERFSIFRNTLAEFLEKEPDPEKRFSFILKRFGELKEQFNLNYETYINKFAFNKFEMEVVSKSDDLLQKLNSTMNDIVTKVLIAPAGFLALKVLGKDSDKTAGLMAIFAISFVLTLLLKYQFSNLKQIKKNIEAVFKNLSNKEKQATKIADSNKKQLLKKRTTIYIYLWVFTIIVWLFFLLCVFDAFRNGAVDKTELFIEEIFVIMRLLEIET